MIPVEEIAPISARDIHRIISFIDLTSLDGNNTEEDVIQLCETARYPIRIADKDHCAAVCVWPNFAKTAATHLHNSSVKIACVAGAFPYSQSSTKVKTAEVREAIANGAQEIDFAINRSLVISGRFDELADEIRAIRDASKDRVLKIIIETCDLPSAELIQKACRIALSNGADFLKTSTGKGKAGATLEHAQILFKEAAAWKRETGKTIGIKPSGGIRHVESALAYVEMADHYLGEVTPKNFRLGASGLLRDCLVRLTSSKAKVEK